MLLTENNFYHIYNQGNNRGRLFYRRENYLFFLRKFRKHVLPISEVVAYCLMPNHFHFILYTTQNSVREESVGKVKVTALMNGIRKLLSSYAQAINKQEHRSGSLFRQKTKTKLLKGSDDNYLFNCFHYIHQNPLRANLVDKIEDWEFSSFQDYMGIRNGSLCNKSLAFDLIGINEASFYQESYLIIAPNKIKFFP